MKLVDELALLMRDPDLYSIPDLAHAIMEGGQDLSQWDAAEMLAILIQMQAVQQRVLLRLAQEIDRLDPSRD
jgi:hypothetical protein